MGNDNSRMLIHEMGKQGNGKRNSHMGHLDLEEEMSGKQSIVCDEVRVTVEMFQQVLLC